MLDTREANILRHALAGRPGPVAERLSRRLDAGPVGRGDLTGEERAEGVAALEAYASGAASFGEIAASAARELRGRP